MAGMPPRFVQVNIKKSVHENISQIAEKEKCFPSEAIDTILSRYVEIYKDKKGGVDSE